MVIACASSTYALIESHLGALDAEFPDAKRGREFPAFAGQWREPAHANASPFVACALPDETTALKPGPNLKVVQNNCAACHSADCISTQPRGAKFKKDFWQAEVTKMIKVYGAPINDGETAAPDGFFAKIESIGILRFCRGK